MERNEDCLEGLKCPRCGSPGPFKIASCCITTIRDDGTEEIGDVDLSDESCCECPACGLRERATPFKSESFRSYSRVSATEGPGKMKCWKCNSFGPFRIEAHFVTTVRDGVIEDDGEMDWSNDSPCRCMACGARGEALSFKTGSFRSYNRVSDKGGRNREDEK